MPYNNGKNLFACDVKDCKQAFSAIDKLTAHKKLHKKPLILISTSEPHISSLQGPQPDDTPARLTKLMDDAGLGSELRNPFEASFRRAGENPSSLHSIDHELPSDNAMPPTTAELLQEVVEREQGEDLRAPVITTRSYSNRIVSELSENGNRGPSSSMDCTIKSSNSPPPTMMTFNNSTINPMLSMPHTIPNHNINRPFPLPFSAAPMSTPHDLRGQPLNVLPDTPSIAHHSASKVGMKRRSNTGSSDDEEERKRKFRENNKLAAQRCRQRKKQEIEDTRRERDRLREENQKLSAKLELCLQNEDKLRSQVEKLKIELAEHNHCNVTLAKKRSVIQYPPPL